MAAAKKTTKKDITEVKAKTITIKEPMKYSNNGITVEVLEPGTYELSELPLVVRNHFSKK